MPRPDVNPVLQGPIRRAVLAIAWPAMLSYLLIFANNFVDYLWVKMVGTEASAGQTAGWTLFWLVASTGQIFSVGITAVVARRVGEKKPRRACHSSAQGFVAAFLGSIVVGAAGWFLVPVMVKGNASSALAAAYTIDYLRTIFAGAPLLFLFYALDGTFKGHGDTRRPLFALALALSLNMVLDPLLIHVAGLEVFGAALATVFAWGVSAALLLAAAVRRGVIERPRVLDFRLMRRIVRIGFPISIHGILFSLVYIFIITEVNKTGGDAATAALGLGLRVEGFAYLASLGCAAAAAAVVGQNLGAGQPGRANAGAWTAVRFGMLISGAWGLLLFVAPRSWVHALSPGPEATGYAVLYFEIVAVSLAFTAVELVIEGAFSGAGNTLPPMLLGIPMTIVRIPAAWLATSLGWGASGIFAALALTSIARGLLFAFWFARGRWPRASV